MPQRKKNTNSTDKIKGIGIEKSSEILIATNKNIANRGVNFMPDENFPQSSEVDNWPSIDSSHKLLKRTDFKKLTFSDTTKPVEQVRSFKVALCGDSITQISSHAQIKSPEKSSSSKQSTDIKSEIDNVDENEWICVSQKKKKNTKVEENIKYIPTNADKIKKKEELKYRKRLIREQKVKEERELKKRDTRIKIVSQDVIDSYFQQSFPHISSRTNPSKYISFQAADNRNLQDTNSVSNDRRSPSFRKNMKSNKIPLVPLLQIGKRKVKTKDLISLNILDLIKKNEKKPVAAIQKPKMKKVVMHKPGKQSEIKKNNMCKIKKNIISQKKLNRENFALYLAKIFDSRTEDKPSHVPAQNVFDIPITQEAVNSNILPEEELPTASISEKFPTVPTIEENVVIELSSEPVKLERNMNVTEDPQITDHMTVNDSVLNTFQTDLIKEINYLNNPIHSRKFREYCNHFITEEVNVLLIKFLELIVKFQIRLYETDVIKARVKQRFYCGLKETWKHINKLTCVVIAPDIKCDAGAVGLDKLLNDILEKCKSSNIGVVFGLNQHKLRRIIRRKCNVSCIGITNFQGAQEVHKELMTAVSFQKEKYDNARKSLIKDNYIQNNN